MKMLKRIVAGIVCAVMSVSVTLTAFADNPLQLNDRLTEQAQKEQERKDKIALDKATQQATQQALVAAGKNNPDLSDLSFYINRKYMTKGEYEAFKWSFIFSQFARPLQDSLIDIFDKKFFQEMISDDFEITSVKQTLINAGLDPSKDDEIIAAMLSNVNFNDLVDTIKANYATYNLVDANGGALTLAEMCCGASYTAYSTATADDGTVTTTYTKASGIQSAYSVTPIYKKYYIYDTMASKISNPYNSLVFNQQILGDSTCEKDIKDLVNDQASVRVPVYIYNSQTVFYTQLAVAGYLRTNSEGIKSAESLVNQYGSSPICIDSYGNICALINSHPVIVIPNFGNPYLTAKYDNGNLTESIDFYNGWVIAFYSRNSRAGNTIYANTDTDKLTLSGGLNFDLSLNSDRVNIAYSQVSVPKSGSLAGSIALVETSDTYNLTGKKYSFENDTKDLAKALGVPYFSEGEDSKRIGYYNVKTIPYILVKDRSSVFFTKTEGTISGTFVSPYNTRFADFAPFTAPSTKDETVRKYYTNTSPVFSPNMGIDQLNTNDNSGWTAIARLLSVVGTSVWTYTDNETITRYNYSGLENNNYGASPSDLVTVVTSFKPEELIGDNRFVTTAGGDFGDKFISTMYLPEEILDVGQNMQAYSSDEKGMLITDYRYLFSGNNADFARYCATFAAVVTNNTGNASLVTKDKSEYLDESGTPSGNLAESTDYFYFQNDCTNSNNKNDFATSIEALNNDNLETALYNYFGLEGDACKKDNIITCAIDEGYITETESTGGDVLNTIRDRIVAKLWSLILSGFGIENINGELMDKDKLASLESLFSVSDSTNRTYDKAMSCVRVSSDARYTKPDFWKWAYEKLEQDCKGVSYTNGTLKVTKSYMDSNTKKGINALELTKFTTTDNEVYYFPKQLVDLGEDKDGTLKITNSCEFAKEWNEDKGYIFMYNKDDSVRTIANSTMTFNFAYSKTALAYAAICVYAALLDEYTGAGSNPDKDPSTTLEQFTEEFSRVSGFDKGDLVALLANHARYNGTDSHTDGLNNLYFYDEYRYFLRNANNLASQIGVANATTFASSVYYWDRYYLVNMALNEDITNSVWNAYTVSIGNGKSYQQMVSDYQDYLDTEHVSKASCSFEQFVKAHSDTYKINTKDKFSNYDIYTSMYYNLVDKTQTFDEYKLKNTLSNESEKSMFYSYLDMDDIVVYPFDVGGTATIYTYGGVGGMLVSAGKGASVNNDNSTQNIITAAQTCYTPITTMMTLQKNTDYVNNTLAEGVNKTQSTSTVTKEELMENAGQFFENPVTSLSYILTGFLYKVHDTIATGNLGNVFSASWLLETKPYTWIMNRYIAIMTIVVVIMLVLKLTQLAMSKEHNYGSIGAALVGIVAMGMVPVIVFNSFIWAFDKSSQWALKNSYNKVLLSQADKLSAVTNSDPSVDAELKAFREQFASIHGDETTPEFEILKEYTYGSGAVYDTVTLDTLVTAVHYTKADKNWYSADEFVKVHKDRYDDFIFYYYYDYIRSEYFNYIKNHKTSSSVSAVYGTVSKITEYSNELNNSRNSSSFMNDKDFINNMASAENTFRGLVGTFRTMLEDTEYVYGPSAQDENRIIYDRPYVKDLVGLYNIMDHFSKGDKTYFDDSYAYIKAYKDSAVMQADSSAASPKLWTDSKVALSYLEEHYDNVDQFRDTNKYSVVTSYLDLFNGRTTSPSDGEQGLPVTPLEKKLCNLSEDIYETTLKCLNYLPSQIHDEAAIVMMALIATFKTNELFGLEPSGPILGTVSLDDVVRAAFVTDLSVISGESNTLYAMIEQGDSIGRVALVVILELIICIASVARVLLILYITGASFVILGLRLFNKTPKTNDLVYGIVGNLLALLFMHALTLFLVVIAVEWVAGATSAIPGLLMDIMMVLFIILMCSLLFKLVKNIILDAVNIGGMKIKSMVHNLADSIVHATGKLFHKGDTEVEADNANVNLQGTVNETIIDERALLREQEQENRRRTQSILSNIEDVERASTLRMVERQQHIQTEDNQQDSNATTESTAQPRQLNIQDDSESDSNNDN